MQYVYEGLIQACKSGKIDHLVVVMSVVFTYMFSWVQPLFLYQYSCTPAAVPVLPAIPVFLYQCSYTKKSRTPDYMDFNFGLNILVIVIWKCFFLDAFLFAQLKIWN